MREAGRGNIADVGRPDSVDWMPRPSPRKVSRCLFALAGSLARCEGSCRNLGDSARKDKVVDRTWGAPVTKCGDDDDDDAADD